MVGEEMEMSGVGRTDPARKDSRIVLTLMFGGTSVLNYAFSLVMGWLLIPGDFGLLAFAQTIILVCGLVLQSGLPWSLSRQMAISPFARHAPMISGTLVANVGLSVGMAAIIVLLYLGGPFADALESAVILLLVISSLPFIAVAAAAKGASQGRERFRVYAALSLIEMALKFVCGTVMVVAGFGVVGAVSGFVFGASVAAVAGLLFVRSIGAGLSGGVEVPIARDAAPIFLALLGITLLLNTHLVALRLFGGERDAVGFYQAGLVLANAPYYLLAAVVTPILFVQCARAGGVPESRTAVAGTLSGVMLFILPMEIALTAAPAEALGLFYPDVYRAGAPTLSLLAAGNALLILCAVFSTVYQAIGEGMKPAVIFLSLIAASVPALFVAVRLGGAPGAALIFAASSALALLALIVAYVSSLEENPFSGVVAWLLRYAGCVGCGLVVGWVILSWGFGIIPAGLAGGAAYAAAALLTRLVSPDSLIRFTGRTRDEKPEKTGGTAGR